MRETLTAWAFRLPSQGAFLPPTSEPHPTGFAENGTCAQKDFEEANLVGEIGCY
jgi:hypothetical protein